MLHHYHDLPLFFGGYYHEQMIAYGGPRTLLEHEARAEQPIRVPRIVSRTAAAAVLVIALLGIADMLSAEPGPAESRPTTSMAIAASAAGD